MLLVSIVTEAIKDIDAADWSANYPETKGVFQLLPVSFLKNAR